jgi:hypothetical protein
MCDSRMGKTTKSYTYAFQSSRSQIKARLSFRPGLRSLAVVCGFTFTSTPLADDEETGSKRELFTSKISAYKIKAGTQLGRNKVSISGNTEKYRERKGQTAKHRHRNLQTHKPKVVGSNPAPLPY